MATPDESLFTPIRDQKRVLCVGNSCVDFINVVKEFPKEDSDQRGLQYYWQRGGNASNNCTVLAELSVPCEFVGVLGSQGAEADWIKKDFTSSGIDISRCVIEDVRCAVATSILTQATGSRTIMYYPRDRPELADKEFTDIFNKDFSHFSWVHFELCSNVDSVSQMMDDVIEFKNRAGQSEIVGGQMKPCCILSVEVEKPEFLHSESVMAKGDVVFISKDFAMSRGYNDAPAALTGLYKFCKPGAVLICPWGDRGAAARCGEVTKSVAAEKISVVDSLGAGDTFVSGCISSFLSQGFLWERENVNNAAESLEKALTVGCRLAELKCTMFGYRGLSEHATRILNM